MSLLQPLDMKIKEPPLTMAALVRSCLLRHPGAFLEAREIAEETGLDLSLTNSAVSNFVTRCLVEKEIPTQSGKRVKVQRYRWIG